MLEKTEGTGNINHKIQNEDKLFLDKKMFKD